MAPFPSLGPLASIVVSRKRRKILRAFHDSSALSPESARSLDDLGLSKSLLFEIQRMRGVIVSADAERFFLDEVREREVQQFRIRLIFSVLFVALILTLVLAWAG